MQSTVFDPLKIAQRYWGMSLVRGVVAIIFGLLAIFWPHLTFALFMLVFGIFAIVEGCILFGSAFTQHTVNTPMANFARRAANTALGTDTTTRNSAQRAEAATRDDYAQESERIAREEFAHGEARPEGYSGARRMPEPQQAATGYVTHRANRSTLMIEGLLSIICGILALILPGVVGALALYAVAAWALFKGFGALMQTGTRGPVLGVIGVLGLIIGLIVLFKPIVVIHSLLWIVGVFAVIMGVMLVMRGLAHKTMSRMTRPMEPNY